MCQDKRVILIYSYYLIIILYNYIIIIYKNGSVLLIGVTVNFLYFFFHLRVEFSSKAKVLSVS